MILRAALAGALGAAAALLVACSGSGGLIPASNAGPLRSDFEAVARAAEEGNGNCSHTESALSKTELDFAALPASVNSELRGTLSQGIANLKVRALALCTQPMPQATNTTPTTETTTETTPTTSTPSTTTPTTPPTTETTPQGPGGGTPAEEEPTGGSEERRGGDGEAGKGNDGEPGA